MLLDSRGHLKLTDLGLCKKIGDVSPSDEPEAILEMMRRQVISSDDPTPEGDSETEGKKDDGIATAADDANTVGKRDAKTRREVGFSMLYVNFAC